MIKTMSVQLVATLLAILVSAPGYAERSGKMDVSFAMPYFQGEEFRFDGGASVDLHSDPGFAFAMAYNVSSHLATRLDFSFNSISYDAERVLDNGSRSRESFYGSLDSFSLTFGGDYYFMPGEFSPYVSGNLGWNSIDTGIVSGPPSTVCWWDPWWGYICDGYQPTYTEDSLVYGVGAGLRLEFTESSFVKLGYYVDYIDLDSVAGTADFSKIKLEIGLMY